MRVERKRKATVEIDPTEFDLLRESIVGDPTPDQIRQLGQAIQKENLRVQIASQEKALETVSDFLD